jgi:hypothetical protein
MARVATLRSATARSATPTRLRAARDGLALAGILAAGLLWTAQEAAGLSWGRDALGYVTFPLASPYAAATGNLDAPVAFRYAPPVALVFLLFRILPWPLFLAAWTILLGAVLWWLAGRWALFLVALPPVLLELHMGNVNLLLAAIIVVGFRYPTAWTFVLLTKVTPGIGVLWFAVRRDWRSCRRLFAATVLLIGVSTLVVPAWWPTWIAMLAADARLSPGVPLSIRMAAAALVIAWAAHGDHRWALPLACTLALPDPGLWAAYTIALGTIPLLGPVQSPAARWARRATTPRPQGPIKQPVGTGSGGG